MARRRKDAFTSVANFMAADNMTTEEERSGRTSKKIRQEIKNKEYETRLEYVQKRDQTRRYGRRLMKVGFGGIAFGFLSVACMYYLHPEYMLKEVAILKDVITTKPPSGPES